MRAPLMVVVVCLASYALPAAMGNDGTRPTNSTYLGGSDFDSLHAADVGPDGSLYVGGWTTSTDFPGATYRGHVVARLSNDLSAPKWSYTFGGAYANDLNGLAVASDGAVYVVGTTSAANIVATPGALDEPSAAISPPPLEHGVCLRRA